MWMYGMDCLICAKPIRDGQHVFGSWGVWLPQEHPLWRFCDGGMHWDCYAPWPHRSRFAASYVDFWVNDEAHNIYWHKAHLDDVVFATVNPSKHLRSTWIHLYATGSRFSVKLDLWDHWVQHGPAEDLHPTESEALSQARARLAQTVPTQALLLDAIDWETKGPVIEDHIQRTRDRKRRERELQRSIQPHNAACNRLMKRIRAAGLACPHCGVESKEYRIARRRKHKSQVICRSCGWTVDPHSLR